MTSSTTRQLARVRVDEIGKARSKAAESNGARV